MIMFMVMAVLVVMVAAVMMMMMIVVVSVSGDALFCLQLRVIDSQTVIKHVITLLT